MLGEEGELIEVLEVEDGGVMVMTGEGEIEVGDRGEGFHTFCGGERVSSLSSLSLLLLCLWVSVVEVGCGCFLLSLSSADVAGECLDEVVVVVVAVGVVLGDEEADEEAEEEDVEEEEEEEDEAVGAEGSFQWVT